MKKLDMLFEGKAKRVFGTDDPSVCVVEYKDDATAFNGQKTGSIEGKGAINNRISNHLMRLLEQHGVPTHFVRELSERETAVKRLEIVKIEVIVRNIAAGSLSQRLGLPEGTKLPCTVREYCYKNDMLGDPLINTYHALALGLAAREELACIDGYALVINEFLTDYLRDLGISLIDMKMEFGRLPDGTIVLADEISPDTCRFWDAKTGKKLDKDRFRRDLGGEAEAYQEVLRRLLGE